MPKPDTPEAKEAGPDRLYASGDADQRGHFALLRLDLSQLETPVYILDEVALLRNLQLLRRLADRSEVRILLALKAFAQYSVFPLIGRYLQGATASSLFEARLAFEELGGELHACAPAYPPQDFEELSRCCDHIVFNSFRQWQTFRGLLPKGVSAGLRINPECSTAERSIYDPCAPGSRLGIRKGDFGDLNFEALNLEDLDCRGISGLHFHTLCEQGFDALQKTLLLVEERFGSLLDRMQWINFGGGHLLTSPGYDLEGLRELIHSFRERHPHLQIYLEPGEAVVRDCGLLMTTVLDIVSGGQGSPPTAILDISASAHIPDVLEMPYRPEVIGAGEPGEKSCSYSLGGLSCLAGDVIGSYSFAEPLQIGQRLYFLDMAHYTMVKNTFFNGLRPPSIAVANGESGEARLIRRFDYQDYRSRLS